MVHQIGKHLQGPTPPQGYRRDERAAIQYFLLLIDHPNIQLHMLVSFDPKDHGSFR